MIRATKLLFGLILGLLLVIAYLIPYEAPLAAVEPYNLINATNPSLVYGVIKNAQNFLERTPCTYEVLGWDSQNNLIFSSSCWIKETSLMRYDPHLEEAVKLDNFKSSAFVDVIYKADLMELVNAADVIPDSYEMSVRSRSIKSLGYRSPDQKYVAFVSQKIYSVQDVLVLKLKSLD